jgi:hypothetical protein
MNITNNKNVNINIYNFTDKELINDDDELFRRIDGYDNYYVSNKGNVKNNKTNKIMKPFNDTGGYKQLNLYKNGKRKMFLIHRLVAIAFIENPDNKKVIDHIDKNKANNNVKNLRWATSKVNKFNQCKYKNNTSGFKGVSFNKKANKYEARININGKTKYLKHYETPEEASEKYEIKAKEIHGDFYYKNK